MTTVSFAKGPDPSRTPITFLTLLLSRLTLTSKSADQPLRMALAGFSELHIGKNVSTPIEEQIGVGFSYSPNTFISFVPFYRWIAAQPQPDHHTQESRPQVDVILRIPLLWRFDVNDRNRCEFRWIDGQPSQRYGNRMLLEHPLTVKGAPRLRPAVPARSVPPLRVTVPPSALLPPTTRFPL